MSTAREKWKRSFAALARKDSSLSVGSQASVMEEETNVDEVEAYLSKLKKKTGVLNLWSGQKFKGVVEGDRTPDISLDSDDELDMKLSMNAENFRQLALDSDEDEMRIDYMRAIRKKKFDKNNNEINTDSDSDDDGPLNLLQNIHFAELKIGDFELSDTELKVNKPDDFIPQLYTVNVNDDKDSESTSELNLRKNIHLLNESVSEITSESQEKNKDSVRAVSSDNSIHTEEEVSEVSNQTSDLKSSTVSYTPLNSKDNPSKDRSRTKSKSSMDSSRSSQTVKTKKNRDSSRTSDCNSDVNTLSSTTSISIDKSEKQSKKKRKKHRHHKSDRSDSRSSGRTRRKNVQTQTKSHTTERTDLTDDVLKFRYYWQQKTPSNIAAHVVDMAAIEGLTNYNPAVLAANDMLKFHLELLQRHITDSQRLYDSYASDSLNRNYKYTTYEDTLKYIKQNKPKVISYQEALKQIQKGK